jgi:hypothetical protein
MGIGGQTEMLSRAKTCTIDEVFDGPKKIGCTVLYTVRP